MVGINEATSETHANRQWEIHVAGIKSIQHLVEFVFERLGGLALRAQGLAAVVSFKFAELRAAEMERDAKTEAQRIQNAASKRDQGWITQDQASTEITGKPAVSKTPLTSATPPGPIDALGNPDPGSNR